MMWLVLLLFAGIIVTPVWIERRKPDMDEQVRANAEGQFARLSDGNTHYQWHGPEDGPVLVCIHGLTTPSYVWEPLLPGLTEAGFRVLTYDLYGRGWSDRPKGAQTRSFFIRQLRDLLQDQGVGGPVSVLGYSMGGSIATVFAAEEPERVAQLLLLAPAGMEHRPTKLSELIRVSGYTGKWLMLTLAARELRQIAHSVKGPDGFNARLAAECSWRGYLPSVLSSQRNMLAETLEEEHRALGKTQVPVLVVWGELDTVIPITAMSRLVQWNHSSKHSVVPGASHALGVTHPTEVLDAFAALLQA